MDVVVTYCPGIEMYVFSKGAVDGLLQLVPGGRVYVMMFCSEVCEQQTGQDRSPRGTLHILSAFLGKEYNLCDRLFSFELQQGRLTSITVEREYFVDSCTPWDVLESVDKAVSGAISKALSQSTHPDAKWLSDKQL